MIAFSRWQRGRMAEDYAQYLIDLGFNQTAASITMAFFLVGLR